MNQRAEDLRIHIIDVYDNGILGEPRDYGIVPAKTTKELAGLVFAKRWWIYRIEVMDPSGKVVLSHDYNMDAPDKIGWKIVIPPLGDN